MDYVCFKNYYDIIAIDLSKQQALDATPKAIQQINFFFGNLHQPEGAIIIFHYQRSKKKKDFSQETVSTVISLPEIVKLSNS